MTELEPLVLCMENISGEEVALKIEPQDSFQDFLENAKLLLGYEMDINSITENQPVSLDSNIYNFLLEAEQNFKNSTLNQQNLDEIMDDNETDDLVYILDDGTQIRASQIQFDNDDPLVDLTAEKIPFVKYKDESDDDNKTDIENTDITIKNINILGSPVERWSSKDSPKCSFANSLPFNVVCNNTSNFEAQFSKYLESNSKTYTNLNNANKNKSPRSLIRENYKKYDDINSRNDGFLTREDILNMFKDTPVTPLPYDDNTQFDKRRHVRKTDPSRLVYKNWNAKPIIDIELGLEKQNCFICCKIVKNNEKLYLFDKEDQMLHRCEQRKYNTQLKIICEKCLTENFKPSRIKSPNQSLDDDEYLVIKNNQQFIFQKTSDINLKSSYFINNINMNNNNTDKIDKINKLTKNKESVEFVKVEIGPDGEIVTKPIDNDVKSDDVIIVKEKKDSSSDVDIIEPEVMEVEAEIDVDNLEDVDEDVKEFLGKYQCDIKNKEFKCRFCQREFKNLDEAIDHCAEHKHELDDGVVFPCPLCDYGYANSKWLKGHLKAAHDNLKEDHEVKDENITIKEEDSTVKEGDDTVKEEKNDKEQNNTPESSPVAKRTRSSIKKIDVDNINNGIDEQQPTENGNIAIQQEQPKVKTEVEQECQDSSDGDSIWIVQTGDDDEQLNNLLRLTDVKSDVNDLKRHKCFSCSQIFPTADSLRTHKCRKRVGKRRFNLLKEKSVVLVSREEDFMKRAQKKIREVEDDENNDLLVVRPRKRKTRELSDPQIVTCHNCNESFTSKVRLKFHMQFHEPTNLLTSEGQYVCAECENATFVSETKLFDHVHFQHSKQKRWQCPLKDCGKTFFLRATLTKHSRTHTDTRRYVCVTCGKRFLDKQTLDEHGVTHLQIKPFQCHICLKQLTRRSRLRMHLRAHEEELSPALVLVCAICSRAFRDHVDAQEHAAKSTECIDEFTSDLKEEPEPTEQLSPTSGIVRHTLPVAESHRNETCIPKEVNNDKSEKLLSPLNDAARNIIRVVDIEKAFRCEYCEDVYYLEEALNSHRTLHKGVKNPFTCHICKVNFATYSRCTTHKTTHGFYKRSTIEGRTEGRTGPASAGILGYGGFPVVKHFLCEDCGRSYLHWTYFQVHRRMKHANENYIFKCNQCELTFPNSWSASYHRKKIHSKNGQDENGGFTKIIRENNRIPCRDCDEVLPDKIALYKHRQKEHCDESLMDKGDWTDNEDSETTVCNKCGHDLHSVAALRQHIKEVHGGSPVARAHSHACPVCARSFRSASVRNEHVRVHTGERPFPCDVCGVAFRRSTAMRNHRLIHTGTRPWGCSRCPKRFRVKSDLKTHMRLKHPAHLAVIEIEGLHCTTEEVLQHLNNNNISRDKVIEITMISFPKNTTNIVPNTMRALSMLSDIPRTQIACDWDTRASSLDQTDVLQPLRRGRGIDKNPRKPTILQRSDEAGQGRQDTYNMPLPNFDGVNTSSLNVQLLLQDDTSELVGGNQMVEPLKLDDGILL
ncbi:zinc finger protein 91-like isoform X1 [Pararge aegeria]|uniref:zinc finger protein 91-like isoform X1 n=2 Tax=Pararge aegeria TaxID=116150 RepID=UPI0019D05113|nr:zinc finger protein 91-like isoform X1 [Pararge aegeria]